MTTQVLLFVGWGSLWESQAVDLTRLLGKDLGMMLLTFLMGLLEIELRKRDSYSPRCLCFNSPHPSSISQKMLSASHLFVLSVPKLPAGFHLILVGSLIPIPRIGAAPLGCWSSIHTWASWAPFLHDCGLSSHGPDTPFPRTSKTTHGRTERSLQLTASSLLSSLLPIIH